MSKVLVFGHQNPDTDAITSALSFAYLQRELGVDAEAVALGHPTEETQFALDYFHTAAPRVIEEASPETDEVMLVDHNEFQQSVSDIEQLTVLAVVDHHRISNFQTANPLYYRAEPVGCTNTVIFKLFKENNVTLPKEIAGLMVSAIISDTLLFKSPTCTPEDIQAAEELANIAQIDLTEYGVEMLKAGTNTDTKTAEQLLNADAKTFPMGKRTVRIGQVNVVDIDDVLTRKEELLAFMSAEATQYQLDLVVLVITDILNSTSVAIVEGKEMDAMHEAFGQSVRDHVVELPGIISRKKQVVPQLTEVLK